MEDFYKRFWGREKSDEHYLLVARLMALLWGVCTVVMALVFMHIASAQIVWSKVMAVTTCGILALMTLAFLPWRVNWRAALAGFVTAYLCLFLMMFFLRITPSVSLVYPLPKDSGVNFLLWPVIGNLVCFGVALLLDRLFPEPRQTSTTVSPQVPAADA